MKLRSALIFLLIVRGAHSEVSPGTGCSPADPVILQADKLIVDGRFAEAHSFLESALAKWESEPAASRNQLVACAMDRVSVAFFRMGNLSSAIAWSLRAVERSRVEPQHPAAAILANNLATLYLETGEFASAERWAREARDIATQKSQDDDPDHQVILTTLASIHAYRGEYARAEPLFRQALFHLERRLGSKHAEVGLAATNLARLYRLQDRYSEAADLYRRAVTAFEASSPNSTWELFAARAGLMVSLAHAGSAAEANTLAAALDSAVPQLPADDVRLAGLLHDIALVRMRSRDFASARQALERALAILESVYGANSSRMIAPLQTYVQILRAAKDKQSAKRTDSRIKALTRSNRQP